MTQVSDSERIAKGEKQCELCFCWGGHYEGCETLKEPVLDGKTGGVLEVEVDGEPAQFVPGEQTTIVESTLTKAEVIAKIAVAQDALDGALIAKKRAAEQAKDAQDEVDRWVSAAQALFHREQDVDPSLFDAAASAAESEANEAEADIE